MNIMNGSLKGRVYEGHEEKAELAFAVNEDRQTVYRIAFEKDLCETDLAKRDYVEVKGN